MTREVDYVDGVTVLGADFLDALQEVHSGGMWNFKLELTTGNTILRVPASTGNDQVGIVVNGKMRFTSVSKTVSLVGLGAGTYNIFVTADTSDREFALAVAVGSSPAGATNYRAIGSVVWNGSVATTLASYAPAVANDHRLDSALAIKVPAVGASTANVVSVATPGASPGNSGVSPAVGEIVLLTAQSSGAENGPWVWNGAAVPMTRPAWYATGHVRAGMLINAGGTNKGIWSLSTTGTIVVGTTVTAWEWVTQVNAAASVGSLRTLGYGSLQAAAGNDPRLQTIMRARVMATSTVTLAAPGTHINGVAMAVSDVFFTPFQTTSSQNGPWVWNGAGVPCTRPSWFATGNVASGAIVSIGWWGNIGAGAIWKLASVGADPPTIDTHNLFWRRVDAYTAANVNRTDANLSGEQFICSLPALRSDGMTGMLLRGGATLYTNNPGGAALYLSIRELTGGAGTVLATTPANALQNVAVPMTVEVPVNAWTYNTEKTFGLYQANSAGTVASLNGGTTPLLYRSWLEAKPYY